MQAYKVIVTILVLLSFRLNAQNYPVYNAYFANPYLYNPAAAASNQAYLYFHHRLQWLNVDGAPQLFAASYNTLIDQTRSGFGAKLSSYKRGLLNTTDISLSYTYSIPIGETSYLHYGVSAGAISNTVDTKNATNPSDPALSGDAANNIQPTANFGILLQTSSGINLGISLPQLFSPTFVSPTFADTKVSPLDNIIATLGYKKSVIGKLVTKRIKGVKRTVKSDDGVAPLELYATYKYSAAGTNQFEGIAKLNVSSNFWVGAGYRQDYGFTAHTGLNVNRIILGYSFELANQPEAGFSGGSHEIFLGLKIGSPKTFKKPAPVFRSALQITNQPQHRARFQPQEAVQEQSADSETGKKASKRYYVVVRTFNDFAKADAYKKKLIDDKFNAEVFYYDKDRKYYVQVLSTLKASEANEEARNLKNYSKLKDAKVLIVSEK
jgi:type IX secretion system PorP/SprF family membrane protein